MKLLAQKLRQTQTPSEQLFWRYVRNRQLCGLKFRRQYVIGRYIVDFCCFEKNLVVEIDGEIHSEGDKPRQDALREGILTQMGYRVIRFTSAEVLSNLEGVLYEVAMQAGVPSPYPLPQGEGTT